MKNKTASSPARANVSGDVVGLILVGLGGVFLAGNVGAEVFGMGPINLTLAWPLALVVLGAYMLSRHS